MFSLRSIGIFFAILQDAAAAPSDATAPAEAQSCGDSGAVQTQLIVSHSLCIHSHPSKVEVAWHMSWH